MSEEIPREVLILLFSRSSSATLPSTQTWPQAFRYPSSVGKGVGQITAMTFHTGGVTNMPWKLFHYSSSTVPAFKSPGTRRREDKKDSMVPRHVDLQFPRDPHGRPVAR